MDHLVAIDSANEGEASASQLRSFTSLLQLVPDAQMGFVVLLNRHGRRSTWSYTLAAPDEGMYLPTANDEADRQ